MLYLIKGRAGSGKTAKMRQTIKKVIEENKYEPLLIVPEQFSFESERTMLKLLGPKSFKNLGIFSFTRLSHNVLKETQVVSRNIPDSGIRLVLMSEALKQLDGNINIFNKSVNNITTLQSLVDFSKELKFCKISENELNEKTKILPNGFLKEKLKEISLIYSGYDALVNQSYFDDTTELDLLCDYALKNNLFNNKVIFIDGFRDFSKQEFELLSIMMSQAKSVYITLCINSHPIKYTPFYFIKKLESSLRAIANSCNCAVEEITCEQDISAFSSNIFALEKNIYSEKEIEKIDSDASVTIVKCIDIDDECKYISATIKRLLRSGKYRCRDIAVIERVSGTYKNILTEELKRLCVPVFEDSRRSLSFETLFIYLDCVLRCITERLTSENIFAFLKTGFSPLSLNEVSRLEKYALIWGVDAKAWSDGFTSHPDGFGKSFDERAQSYLNSINESREKAIGPILKLKGDCKEKNGREITELIYNFLVNQDIQGKLYSLYESLNNDGFPVEANRQAVSWDRLIHILDSIDSLTKDKAITLKEWYEIYKILVSSEEIGEIPQGLDEITIGSADRIRTEKKKVCFLLGVNKDEFPLVNVKNGILTDDDRVSLTNIGLGIRPPFKDTVDEERFITYCALTAGSECLFLSYKTVDSNGGELYPSEIIDTATACIRDCKVINTSEISPMEYIESEDSAFSVLCDNFNDTSEIFSTLFEFFKDKQEYVSKINAVNNLLNKRNYNIKNKDISVSLFKENMQISASRVEAFYKCPFAYFMRYGLKAEPVKTAELDPSQSGLVVHAVMENLLKEYPKGEFINTDNSELKHFVNKVLTDYINEKMGGFDNKSSRFIFLYNHLIETCMAIIDRLKTEFSVGSFEPCGFEVKIGDENVPQYEVELDNGVAQIRGYIDRVDMMEKDGIKYLRVIDYKTGIKDFNLSEVIDGLNIQMILYLMALEKNGKKVYGDFIPSAVLYLPSKIGFSKYLKLRHPEPEEVTHTKKISGKLSGMMLNSPVVFNGMGITENPEYFPVDYNAKKNIFTGNLYSQKDFKGISRYIVSKICNMGNALHNGEVNAVPLGTDNCGKMCSYCSYKSICGYEQGDEIVEMTKLKHNDALAILGGEQDE